MVLVEVMEVAVVAASQDPTVNTINSPVIDGANVQIVECPTSQDNAQPMAKPAINVVKTITLPDTAKRY